LRECIKKALLSGRSGKDGGLMISRGFSEGRKDCGTASGSSLKRQPVLLGIDYDAGHGMGWTKRENDN
jgi:hypothetical protein